MYGFRIVEELQKLDEDIQREQLAYHQKRVMVSKEFTFDAAHHLHGHTYQVVFGISGFVDEIGMVIDFGDIKQIWKDRIEVFLDHRYLNETLPKMNTTAENMVVWIFEQMEAAVQELPKPCRVEFVRLFETPTSYAEARREWMDHA